jgi:hypothetical protein
MPLALLSPESQTNSILDSVGCAVSNFSAIVGTLSNSRVTAALSGQNDFSQEDGEQHLRVAREMQRLMNETGLPIDWRRVEKVREVLARRRQHVV